MSEREPITAGVRELLDASTHRWVGDIVVCIEVAENAIFERLDAIDAVHANLERENERLRAECKSGTDAAWRRGYDEGFASADDWLAQNEDAMAEHGWVRLPLDADGETIRVGDRMRSDKGLTYTVECLGLTADGWLLIGPNNSRVSTAAWHHDGPDTPAKLREDAERFEQAAKRRALASRQAFYDGLHELVERACALAGKEQQWRA